MNTYHDIVHFTQMHVFLVQTRTVGAWAFLTGTSTSNNTYTNRSEILKITSTLQASTVYHKNRLFKIYIYTCIYKFNLQSILQDWSRITIRTFLFTK